MLLLETAMHGQSVSTCLPSAPDKTGNYLFYLHGAVVTVHGNNAINEAMPEWGPYEYLNILDSLRNRGFHVISEIRQQGVEDQVYADKIVRQLDTLFKAGVHAENIMLVGASSGWDIVLLVSEKVARQDVNFVLMGGCRADTYKAYALRRLQGRFLSVIESSDPHGSCTAIFRGRAQLVYREITLHTGRSHGFLYRGYKEWIDPVVAWFYETGKRKITGKNKPVK